MTPFQTHPLLTHETVAHGFFGREGGVSKGLYGTLNTGYGSDDNPENVKENRRRIAASLGASEPQLQSLHQIHSRDVVIIDSPSLERPKADGLVTKTPGLAISALSAFRNTLISKDERFDRFFRLGPEKENGPRQPHFDLKGFILAKLKAAGLTRIDMLADCTYGQPEAYFSYRFNTHQGERDYGRNISAIMLR